MKQKSITAPQLRIALCVSLVLVAAIGVVIFKFGYGKLNSVAHSVAETAAKADASQDDLQHLAVTKQELADNADVVKKASEIVAESKSYQYQNQIVTDLNRFADKAGITITAISFAANTSTTKPAGTTPSAPVAGGGSPSLKTVSATISIKNPVSYKHFLQFIHDIEQNLTKMQLQSLSLSKSPDGGISSDNLTIQVYVK